MQRPTRLLPGEAVRTGKQSTHAPVRSARALDTARWTGDAGHRGRPVRVAGPGCNILRERWWLRAGVGQGHGRGRVMPGEGREGMSASVRRPVTNRLTPSLGRTRRLRRRRSCATQGLSHRPRRWRVTRPSVPARFMARSAPGSLWSRSVRTTRGLRVASRLSARQKKRRAASWGGFLVPLGAEQKADRLARAVDRSAE
jgi:hypothetical protein